MFWFCKTDICRRCGHIGWRWSRLGRLTEPKLHLRQPNKQCRMELDLVDVGWPRVLEPWLNGCVVPRTGHRKAHACGLPPSLLTSTVLSVLSLSVMLHWTAHQRHQCCPSVGAYEPWSGNFDVSVGVWAQAQTTQFVQLGAHYFMYGISTGGSGLLEGGGTCVNQHLTLLLSCYMQLCCAT